MASWLLATVVFLASAGTYLLFAGQIGGTEIGACLPAAAAVALFAALQHRGQRRVIQLRAPPGRVLFTPAVALLRDCWRVGGVLLRAMARRPPAGTIDRQRFRRGDDRPREAGRRALVTLGNSFAPNGFVVDVAPSVLLGDADLMLIHHLAPDAAATDPEWPV